MSKKTTKGGLMAWASTRTWFLTFALIMGIGFTLAGCGGGDSDSGSGKDPVDPPSATVPSTPQNFVATVGDTRVRFARRTSIR